MFWTKYIITHISSFKLKLHQRYFIKKLTPLQLAVLFLNTSPTYESVEAIFYYQGMLGMQACCLLPGLDVNWDQNN